MTIITLSIALMAFTYGGIVAECNKARVTNAPQTGATSSTAPRGSNPGVKPRDQGTAELTKQLDEAPDIEINVDNSSDAPLAIKSARVRAILSPPVSGSRETRTAYEIRPDVELQNANARRVTGLVLLFGCGGRVEDRVISGVGGLNMIPGADYQFKMLPGRETFRLYCDLNRLRVSVAAVLLEGEDLWVKDDQTGDRPERGSGTQPSSPGKPGSVPEDPSAPRSPDRLAKAPTDVACAGYGGPVHLLKMLGDSIGLTIVFEGPAGVVQDRIRMADAFYLRNLRREHIIEIILRLHSLKYARSGNQLTVELGAFPESLHRLTLAN